jgi:hypothetical protein
MTLQPTSRIQHGRFIINKLLAAIFGMVVMALCGFVVLWRGAICIPDQRFYSLLFGVPFLGLYIAVVINLSRLRRQLEEAPFREPGNQGNQGT